MEDSDVRSERMKGSQGVILKSSSSVRVVKSRGSGESHIRRQGSWVAFQAVRFSVEGQNYI